MDKFFKTSRGFSSTRRLLEAINRTTDDFLFVFDMPQNEIWFFGSIDERFSVRAPGNQTSTLEEVLAVVHPRDRKSLEEEIARIARGEQLQHDRNCRWIDREGNSVWVNVRGKVVQDEDGVPLIMIGRVSEEAVRHLCNRLTGLWNKNKLREDIRPLLEQSGKYLMLLDIHGLADINLIHGREFGDALLRAVAATLDEATSVEQVYHIDHNNFAVVIDATKEAEVSALFAFVCAAFEEKCTFSASAVPIEKSIFINEGQLIDSANVILNSAKKKTVRGLDFFSAEEIDRRVRSRALLKELNESVQNGFEGFEVYYQPQVRGSSYELLGVEALLRYTSKERGRIFPDAFIPLLEQSRLIEQVGMWVLDTALAQCKVWRESLPELHVSVNFSAVQFEDRHIGEKIVDALKRADLPGSALAVELTESHQLRENEHFYNRLKYIRAYGVRFAIDDFGTGYSNLGYLKTLDVTAIKIDRSFVADIEKGTYNFNLIGNMIEFAKANSIHTCCEGVETKKELSILESLQPDSLQGYLFDKPCTAEEIHEKYICRTTDAYQNRVAAVQEICRYNEESGMIYFDPRSILRDNDVGLWIVRIDREKNLYELHADETMLHVLGLSERISPVECYRYWYDRIHSEHIAVVDNSLSVMYHGGKMVQFRYIWKHPTLGDVLVRSSGRRVREENGMVIMEGYHRMLTDVEGI